MGKNPLEDLRDKERKNNPAGNFADAVNRSMVGDPIAIAGGGCLTKIVTLVILIAVALILLKCSS